MIDAAYLQAAGFRPVSQEQERELLQIITSIAERRVLYALTEHFSDKMQQEIEDDSIMPDETWLAEHLPNYKQIIENELELMKQEMAALHKVQGHSQPA